MKKIWTLLLFSLAVATLGQETPRARVVPVHSTVVSLPPCGPAVAIGSACIWQPPNNYLSGIIDYTVPSVKHCRPMWLYLDESSYPAVTQVLTSGFQMGRQAFAQGNIRITEGMNVFCGFENLPTGGVAFKCHTIELSDGSCP